MSLMHCPCQDPEFYFFRLNFHRTKDVNQQMIVVKSKEFTNTSVIAANVLLFQMLTDFVPFLDILNDISCL